MTWMPGRLAALAGALLCAAAWPIPAGAVQEARADERAAPGPPIPFVDDFIHDGGVGEWRARPIDRILPATGSIPQALLWVGQVDEGIVVAAEIRSGVTPDAEATLRIGVRGAGDIALPPIGWGHQFGFVVLEEASDCEDREVGEDDPTVCQAWLARQRDFRAALPPLFEREWRLRLTGTDDIREAAAGPAFARLPEAARAALAPLEPGGGPSARSRPIVGTEGGVGIEVLIPWSAFPPVRAPLLEAARIALDWVDPAAEAAWDRAWLAAAGVRPLGAPLDHTITPCAYGVARLLIPGGDGRMSRPASDGAVAYMIPEGSGDLRSLIVLDNVAAGYQYEPGPDTWSPAAYRPTYGVLDVGRGERICTPVLAFAPAGDDAPPVTRATTSEGDWFALQVEPRELEVRRLDDGDLLVKSGGRVVWSYYGSGQCGACPRVGIDMFHISTESGTITPALRFMQTAEPTVRDFEIDVTDDWGTITIYRSEPRLGTDDLEVDWSLTRHCLVLTPGVPAVYEECGSESNVDAPPARLRNRYLSGPPG
ncbi:MAG: hypothetical protein R3195_08875 [Gemmatimonadota bacterium]|nr:hypothetical protein [Gemmatimonadota bacterium]